MRHREVMTVKQVSVGESSSGNRVWWVFLERGKRMIVEPLLPNYAPARWRMNQFLDSLHPKITDSIFYKEDLVGCRTRVVIREEEPDRAWVFEKPYTRIPEARVQF